MDGCRYRSYKRDIIKINVTHKPCSGSLDYSGEPYIFFDYERERNVCNIDTKVNNDILQYAIEKGMIDIAYMQEQIEMNKRKELLEKHPYKIWEGSDHLWHTYLPDNEKGRVPRKRRTESEIQDVVCEYWKKELENPTVKDVYNDWICGKYEREEISKATVDRYQRQFDESMSEFGKRRIKSVEECDIEDFILSAIYENELTVKGYSNLRTLIYGIFKRAKKKKYIDYSITEVISDIDISRKLFRKNKKSDEQLVFSEVETEKITNYIEPSDADIIDLGILLLFKTGLRPGELCGLKREDVGKNKIHVLRTEINYKDENGKNVYEVRDFPKTEAGIRDVIVPNSSQWILSEIRKRNPFGEYVFERGGKRIRTYTFTFRLKLICRKLGIAERSLNKIRKTYASILIDGGADESLVISQMGHTDIKTTKNFYYKNRKNDIQKEEQINNVIGL